MRAVSLFEQTPPDLLLVMNLYLCPSPIRLSVPGAKIIRLEAPALRSVKLLRTK